jgi:hypothetical protein
MEHKMKVATAFYACQYNVSCIYVLRVTRLKCDQITVADFAVHGRTSWPDVHRLARL